MGAMKIIRIASQLSAKDENHCFCCCNTAKSHRMMFRFMNETISWILQICKSFHLSQNVSLELFKHETANECRKTFKQSYIDKKEWV